MLFVSYISVKLGGKKETITIAFIQSINFHIKCGNTPDTI